MSRSLSKAGIQFRMAAPPRAQPAAPLCLHQGLSAATRLTRAMPAAVHVASQGAMAGEASREECEASASDTPEEGVAKTVLSRENEWSISRARALFTERAAQSTGSKKM